MIAIGCDHGGYELKQKILAHLRQRGLEYRDFGCDSTASVDYPVYGKAVAHAVASGECEKGIVICSTGIGISIAANKVPSIRCALCGDCFSAKATRLHNNANVLALGCAGHRTRPGAGNRGHLPGHAFLGGGASQPSGIPAGGRIMFELCASILAADFANLERDMRAANAAGVDAFHIDVMDGHFVPAISFGTGMVRTMERLTTKPLDVHLMVEKPLDFLPELEELGVKRVSVHYEIPGGRKRPAAICAAGMQAGLVLNPETPVESALPYLAQISQLLLMTVYPGRGGQVYLPGSNEKIAAAKSLLQGQGSNTVIQVDGGITPGTLPGAYAAGARSIVAGSAVFYGNIYQNVCALRSEKAKP